MKFKRNCIRGVGVIATESIEDGNELYLDYLYNFS